MTALAKDVSKLTERYQTTVPASVRKQLKLGKGDQIRYCTEPSGRVYIEPVSIMSRPISRRIRTVFGRSMGPCMAVLQHWSETLTSISMRRYRSRMNDRR